MAYCDLVDHEEEDEDFLEDSGINVILMCEQPDKYIDKYQYIRNTIFNSEQVNELVTMFNEMRQLQARLYNNLQKAALSKDYARHK